MSNEVSLMLVTYNSSFDRIKKTLISFLEQEAVSFEVIVTDDGSPDNHKKEIETLFSDYNFTNYKLVISAINRGIVLNYGAGLTIAEGKYIKDLGAGDYLYDKYTIRNWINFLETSGAEWSISDAIYYDSKTKKIISGFANPQNMNPYKKHRVLEARWNYVVLNDIALGAVMLCKTQLQKEYYSRIVTKGIKYAEDNMWRLMMFDGIVASYYEKPTVYYEYSCGISTSENNYWSERLHEDWIKTDAMMGETENLDNFQKEMLRNMKTKNFWGKILTKGKLIHALKTKFMPRKTSL